MKLSIHGRGLRRSTAPARVLGLVGAVLARATGVRRVRLRVQPEAEPPRAELVIERRDAVRAYRLRGRLLRWTHDATRRLIARWSPSSTPQLSRG